MQTGQELNGEDLANRIECNQVATEVYERFARQLGIWDVDTQQMPWNVGHQLTFDPQGETFTEGESLDAANDLVKREDREPFVVPEINV